MCLAVVAIVAPNRKAKADELDPGEMLSLSAGGTNTCMVKRVIAASLEAIAAVTCAGDSLADHLNCQPAMQRWVQAEYDADVACGG